MYRDDDGSLRLVILKVMRIQIIRRIHEMGYFGEMLVRKDFWIPDLKSKVEKTIQNCVLCILAEKKTSKMEGFLNPLEKGSIPLDTFHIDHFGPLHSTSEQYKHIFRVVNGFSKFTWLYATKSTGTAEVNDKLKKQSAVFETLDELFQIGVQLLHRVNSNNIVRIKIYNTI